jgi:hypothetical protein
VENEFEDIDEEVNTTNDDDANKKANIGTDIDGIDLIGGILTSGDGTSSMPYTKALITDPEKLKPVRMHVTIKKRKGDLLERLKLSRVKFSDNKHDALDAMEDPQVHTMKLMKLERNKSFQLNPPKQLKRFGKSTTLSGKILMMKCKQSRLSIQKHWTTSLPRVLPNGSGRRIKITKHIYRNGLTG